MTEDGAPVVDSVTVTFAEYYTHKDILLAGLLTVSDGEPLETGGMLHLAAEAGGQDLALAADKQLVVHFPKSGTWGGSDMQPFYAATATDSAVTDWKRDTNALLKETISIYSWGFYYYSMADSTPIESKPRGFVDTGYYWNPLEYYVSSYPFSEAAIAYFNQHTSLPLHQIEFFIGTDRVISNPRIKLRAPAAIRQELRRFVEGIPPLMPSRDKYANIVERRGIIGVGPGPVIPTCKTREGYKRSFSEKYRTDERSPIKNVDDAELNYYILSVSRLGWINCDRFINGFETTDLLVEVPVREGRDVRLVFRDVNGVLRADTLGGRYVFSNVPLGEAATLLCLQNDAEGLQTAFEDVVIADRPVGNIVLQPTTVAAFTARLEAL